MDSGWARMDLNGHRGIDRRYVEAYNYNKHLNIGCLQGRVT